MPNYLIFGQCQCLWRANKSLTMYSLYFEFPNLFKFIVNSNKICFCVRFCDYKFQIKKRSCDIKFLFNINRIMSFTIKRRHERRQFISIFFLAFSYCHHGDYRIAINLADNIHMICRKMRNVLINHANHIWIQE